MKNGNLLKRYCFLTLLISTVFLNFGITSVFGDVIIDNDDIGTSYTGAWPVSGGTSPYGDDSLWSRNGDTYTWGFDSQPAGTYEVLMWWSQWPSRGTEINVEINYDGFTDVVEINQHEDAGQWNSLGTYYFDTAGSVTIIAADGSTVSTSADAVWFRYVSSNVIPTAHIDSIVPNPADPCQVIEFTGHGLDTDGIIEGYLWGSDIDGFLSDANNFSTASLSEGVHAISFEVQDNNGIWSVPAEETLIVGDVPVEVIIDNTDAATSYDQEDWPPSSAIDFYGEDSVWSRDGATFTWYFSPPENGEYEISMCWSTWPSRSPSVPIQIQHLDGEDTVFVNQQENGGQWNSIGSYYFFNSRTIYAITITSPPSPSSTCADAVKFDLLQTNRLPAAYIDSILPNPAELTDDIEFIGHGTDTDGNVIAYKWESSSNGILSTEPNFVMAGSLIGQGTHTISFSVMDNNDLWSPIVTEELTIGNMAPVAVIDSIIPNPAYIGQMISFSGHGQDADGSIASCSWESDISGHLSDANSFSTDLLPLGNHTITFKVYDDEAMPSEPVTQLLTIDEIADEFIIDNDDPGTSFTGSWPISGGIGPYGTNSLWSRDGSVYRWNFTPQSSDFYEVYMWWSYWPSRSTNVPANIEYSGDNTTIYVNQQQNGGQWNTLGEYYFEAGQNYNVTITSQPGPSSTCADAVKFVKIGEPSPPIADFYANPTRVGAPFTIQFFNSSLGVASEYLWDFGDGQTSSQKNPAHEYTEMGLYTVSLTVTNASGSDKETKTHYIEVLNSQENIYLIDAYSGSENFVPGVAEMLANLGAVRSGDTWIYNNSGANLTHYMYLVTDPITFEHTLKEENSHIVFKGHSNFGFGATFATSEQIWKQEIDNVYFVDDDHFTNYSSDMVSTKVDGMKYGQAYPNWEPIFKDGTSAIMPYDFSEGIPPYNYYQTYTLPGDPNVYRVELLDGSYLERFPDASTPVWYSADGLPPDPVANSEYFITNSELEFNHFSWVGYWPLGEIAGAGYMGETGYLGYNFQSHEPGYGANVATWTLVIKNPGLYAVMASWYASPNNASNAKYTIHHAAGSDVVEVDQRETQLTNMLGVYYFDQGAYTVDINDNANARVIADAVILSPLDNPEKILQAEFNAHTTSGNAPLEVQFFSLSAFYSLSDVSGGIDEYYWEFGDGSFSTLREPLHTYTSSGLYTVSLKVTDTSGQEATEVKTGYIAVGTTQPVRAEFTSLSRLGSDKTIVTFADQSSGDIDSWHWDFGDGQTSDEQNPIHVYDDPGNSYDVTLSVSGPGGSDSQTEVDFVYNIIGLVYADNTFQTKQHFYSSRVGSPITFGKVICYTGDVKIQEEELGFHRMFYGGCNSFNYYIDTFCRGIVFGKTENSKHYTSIDYLKYYLLGYTDAEILANLNAVDAIHEYYDFHLKPPSMR